MKYCEVCETNVCNFKRHLLTKKHIDNVNGDNPKHCKVCNKSFKNMSNFKRHLKTNKHLNNVNKTKCFFDYNFKKYCEEFFNSLVRPFFIEDVNFLFFLHEEIRLKVLNDLIIQFNSNNTILFYSGKNCKRSLSSSSFIRYLLIFLKLNMSRDNINILKNDILKVMVSKGI